MVCKHSHSVPGGCSSKQHMYTINLATGAANYTLRHWRIEVIAPFASLLAPLSLLSTVVSDTTLKGDATDPFCMYWATSRVRHTIPLPSKVRFSLICTYLLTLPPFLTSIVSSSLAPYPFFLPLPFAYVSTDWAMRMRGNLAIRSMVPSARRWMNAKGQARRQIVLSPWCAIVWVHY